MAKREFKPVESLATSATSTGNSATVTELARVSMAKREFKPVESLATSATAAGNSAAVTELARVSMAKRESDAARKSGDVRYRSVIVPPRDTGGNARI